jgi:heme/copper-type cytochrome/quinol oxidase subunit 2
MRSSVRWIVIAGTLAGVIVLFIILRPAPESPSTPTPSTPTPSGSSPTSSPEPAPTMIEVTVENGVVHAPTEPTAHQGDEVRIVVRADVTDEVHLHGYDLHADVAPDRPATIEFVATATGVYECELEDAGKLLFRLEIVP